MNCLYIYICYYIVLPLLMNSCLRRVHHCVECLKITTKTAFSILLYCKFHVRHFHVLLFHALRFDYDTIRYETLCFNVRSKADMNQLNLLQNHVLQFHVLHFLWSAVFMSVIFSQPSKTSDNQCC